MCLIAHEKIQDLPQLNAVSQTAAHPNVDLATRCLASVIIGAFNVALSEHKFSLFAENRDDLCFQ
jgi:hypothetical protein